MSTENSDTPTLFEDIADASATLEETVEFVRSVFAGIQEGVTISDRLNAAELLYSLASSFIQISKQREYMANLQTSALQEAGPPIDEDVPNFEVVEGDAN